MPIVEVTAPLENTLELSLISKLNCVPDNVSGTTNGFCALSGETIKRESKLSSDFFIVNDSFNLVKLGKILKKAL